MDTITLTLIRMKQQGKTKMVNGVLVYDWNDFIDNLIEVRDAIISHRSNCPQCKKKTKYTVCPLIGQCVICDTIPNP